MALQSRQRAAATTGRITAPGAAIGAVLLAHKVVPRGLRAAIDAGWIVQDPSPITRRALTTPNTRRVLNVIDYEVLWLALHLDVDEIDADAFARKLRRRSQQYADDARMLRERTALIEQVIGPELESTLARTHANARRSGEVLADLELARDHLAASATIAADWHRRYEGVVARAERRASMRYSGRWRAAVLGWLLRTLGAGWTRRNLAELIIASETDFTPTRRPPCSAFVGGNSANQLADRIKHIIASHAKPDHRSGTHRQS